MVTVDSGKDDSKQGLLSREPTQEDAPPPSYSAANGAGPSTDRMSYAQVAGRQPQAQNVAPAHATAQYSYQAGPHPNQYAQYSAAPPAAYRPGYTYTYHPAGPPALPPHEPAWKRFLKAAGVAILVWVLLGMLTSSIADRIPSIISKFGEPTNPVAADGTVQACYGHGSHSESEDTDQHWNEVPGTGSWSRRASVDLDLGDAKDAALYLLTRGASAAGSVTFEEGSSEKVGVRVVVDYDSLYAAGKVWQLCTLERNGERGVGLYLPDYLRGGGSITWRRFNVHATISLPKKTHIAKFSTDTRNYAHDFNVGEGTTFDSLFLRGTNSRIETKTPLISGSVDASTTNGRISGTYSGSTLTLVTTNAVISGTYNATSLTLKTTNGAVDVDTTVGRTVTISSSNAHIRGPISFIGDARSFDASVHTTNGAIEVRVPTLPLGAALELDARTSNAGSSILLPATYEGRIWQSTSNSGTPSLVVNPGLRDPSGRDREYTVQNVESGKRQREDRVGWGNEHGAGQVRLKTSNGASGVRIVQNP